MIAIYPIHLLPPFTTSVLKTQVDVCEGLLDLRLNVGRDYAGFRVPAAWESLDREKEDGDEGEKSIYPGLSIQCGHQRGQLACIHIAPCFARRHRDMRSTEDAT